MIDKIYFVILVLNVTGLFGFIAPQLGVTIGQVSLALLVLNILYLLFMVRYSTMVLLKVGMIEWLFVLLIWPLITAFYAPSFEIREIGLQLYYFTLFYGAIVYTVANGLPSMHRLMTVSLVLTIFGMGLNLINPQYFEVVSDMAEAKVLKQARVCGFILQPNQLAVCINLMFIGWFSLRKWKNAWLEMIVIIMFLLAVLLTGSRTGMLLAVIVVIFVLLPIRKNRKWVINKRYLMKLGTLMLALVAGIVAMKFYLAQINYTDKKEDELINRMELMLDFKLSDEDNIKDIENVQARVDAQAFYWLLFKERPLFGHGFGAEAYYKEIGYIFLSAHSDALTFAVEYGVFYPVVFILLLLSIYFKRNRRDIEGVFDTNTIGQFVAVMIPVTLIASIRDTRTSYVVWGMVSAMIYCPKGIFRYDKCTHKISGVLSKSEIARLYTKIPKSR
jgi:O-antigen ligase